MSNELSVVSRAGGEITGSNSTIGQVAATFYAVKHTYQILLQRYNVFNILKIKTLQLLTVGIYFGILNHN